MTGSLAKRAALLDELSEYFLRQLVHLGGGYCTALQAETLGIAGTASLKGFEDGFGCWSGWAFCGA